MLTRVRGSDFAVLIPDCADRSTVRAAASRLRDRLTGWLRIEGDRVAVTVTAGVAWSDDDGSIDLLEEAYLSSRQEKSQRAATSEHTPLDDGILLDELRRAIEQDELRLLYQPQIDARSGLLLCAEALVRWQHPVRGLLDPHVFLPLAEDSGLMEPLGDWVIDRGARMARAWLDAYGGRGIPVVVNLSASQVGQGERIALVLGARSSATHSTARRSSPRSPSRVSSPTCPVRPEPSAPSGRSASRWRSTTSAPGIHRFRTCDSCRCRR